MSPTQPSAFYEKRKKREEKKKTKDPGIAALVLSLSLILTVLWLPLYVSPLAFCRLLPSVLFSVWQLSGPTWPRLISVSYRSWRVRPSPLNPDRLAGWPHIFAQDAVFPSSSLHRCCCCRAVRAAARHRRMRRGSKY